MPFPRITDDLNIIAALDNLPNDTGGLTPAQFKAKFDKASLTIQTFINNTLLITLEGATGANSIGFTPPTGMISLTLSTAIAEIYAAAINAQAGTIFPGSITNAMLAGNITADNLAGNIPDTKLTVTPAYFAHGGSTFAMGGTTQTVTNSFITANTQVIISPTQVKQGAWTVVSAAGSFTVTSDTTETATVTFDWGATK